MTGNIENKPIVYIDGACKNNGRPNAQGGCGVFWVVDHQLNVSEALFGIKIELKSQQPLLH
jgi:ribonuclease HI